MNVAGFIEAFRADLDDQEAPYFWSDEDIVRYLNDAVNEAAERALLIEDSTTAECCEITLVPGTGTYPLHTSVIAVKRATFNGKMLDFTSIEAEDENGASWEAQTGPQPRKYIVNGNASEIRILPEPTAAGTVRLTVFRTPLEPLSADVETGVPELKVIYHERLKNWVYRCAYLKKDGEVFDEAAAARYEALFVAAFGERPTAKVRRNRNDRRPHVVRMNSGW
ncbi:MAG: DUF6682 family protein [Limnohabitans sp.]